MVLIKTLLYTGVRVAELVAIRLGDVDLDACRIRITAGKGNKDRMVPFPVSFRETLALHIETQRAKDAGFLFESSWKKPYSTRGVRKLLTRYATAAGITSPISPHRLRHFPADLVEGPGHRRRTHPALQRPRTPAVPGGLLPPVADRRAATLRRGHRPLPGVSTPRLGLVTVFLPTPQVVWQATSIKHASDDEIRAHGDVVVVADTVSPAEAVRLANLTT